MATSAPRHAPYDGVAELGHALDAIPDGFFLLDGDGTIRAANAHAWALCSRDVRELDRASLFAMLPEPAAEIMRRELGAVAHQRQARSFDVQLHEADRWYAVHAHPAGGRVMLHLHDVTARHNTEDALAFLAQASTELVGALEETQVAAALARTMTPRLADWCLVALREGGDGPFRFEVAAMDAEVRERVIGATAQGSAGGRATRSILLRGSSATSPVLLSRRGRPQGLAASGLWLVGDSLLLLSLAGHDGALGAVVLGRLGGSGQFSDEDMRLAADVVGRAGLVLENVRLVEAERRATRLREDALTVVAHDLRSPVNAIVLGATALPDDASGQQTEVYRVARRSLLVASRQMKRLLEDLVDAGRYAAGWVPRDRSAVSLVRLLEELAQTYRLEARQRGIHLELSIDAAADGALDADAGRMQEALGNLLDNALKFTPRGGSVKVTMERSARTARVTVRDTGCGIEESALPHVFDRFWQARTSGRAGAGLGLFIARRIVEAHGGRIRVASRHGRGSVFQVELPCRDLAPGEESHVRDGSVDS